MFYNAYTIKIGSDNMNNNTITNANEEIKLVNYNVGEIET